MFDWFFQGGFFINLALTVLFLLSFILAWKSPSRLRSLSTLAVLVAVLSVCIKAIGFFESLSIAEGSISPGLLYSTLKLYAIELTFGLSVAAVATILRFFTKPRKY